MYVCERCVKGDCHRSREDDRFNQRAYKCDTCNAIQYHKKESKRQIINRINRLNEKIKILENEKRIEEEKL